MHYFQKNGASLLLHLCFLPAFFALTFVGDNAEPFSLALLFATLSSGLSPILCPLFYLLSTLFFWNVKLFLVYVAQALVLSVGFFLQDKYRAKNGTRTLWISFLFLGFSLLLFCVASPFNAYTLPLLTIEFFSSALVQKVLISLIIFLFSATTLIGVKSIIFKLLKCRLSGEELLFSLLFLLLTGIGISRLLGVYAYMGIAFFILLVFATVTKDSTAFLAAFFLGLPATLVGGVPLEKFFLYGVAIVSTAPFGRLACTSAFLAVHFIYAWFDGIFLVSSNLLLPVVLSATLPALLFVVFPTPLLHALERKLVFYREKHLSRVAINRNRAAIGERLFEISGVFREIQATFTSLGSTEAEDSAKDFLCRQVLNSCCLGCEQRKKCTKVGFVGQVRKLVDIGCAKGKATLIDVPSALAALCVKQNELLFSINRQLGDYHQCMVEAENAAAGRELLAGQAQGVSEILKNLALDQSEPITVYTQKEKELSVAFLKAGIVCSEILITGEDGDFTLSLVAYGNTTVKKISTVASAFFALPMIASERIPLSKDKYCCILKRRPKYDAAFGVATVPKQGEEKSGDTHSVIKIDERKFLVALSDGMGSGEYARRISESTISLLESFYRAKMPSNTVLSTVNKLLTFNKEESFACVDIAVVDLDSGKADIVKIGSPSGFILSGTTLKILESATLPLGILESLHPVTASHVLEEDDVLLFLSDGITSAFGSTSDLYEILKTVPTANPQQLADGLLYRALEAYGGKAMDDMTVLAVRLFAA